MMMTGTERELSGKVAIVTGAGRLRGIGRATANVLARMGADVVVTGTGRAPATFPPDEQEAGWRDIDSTADEVRSFGVKALPVVMDVTKAHEVQQLIDDTVAELGSVDILINNAAAPYGEDRVPVIEVAEHVFKKVLEVKVVGTYLCSKTAAIQMIEQGSGGRIVNISSTAGKRGSANTAAYNASNFAVDGFTQALSKELARHEITANCVCPGMTETARLDPIGRGDEWRDRAAQVPIGRPAEDMEVGELIGFLCSPRAAYITGQAININGGSVTER
jgi:3-oxoacyl-[acyl-carrier protein] reductase/meso-butanediol dehydrogenase/(S,S)-butanediol dehydrogenase/diacetyl reductase